MIKHQEQTLKHKISKEEKSEILLMIENKNSFETERILNEVFQVPVKHEEKMTAQADGSVILQLTISKELLTKLTECKNIFSHVKHNSSWAEVIELQSEFVIAKKSPSREVKELKSKSPCELKSSDELGNNFESLRGEVVPPAELNLEDLEVARIPLTRSLAVRVRRFVRAKDRRDVFRSSADVRGEAPRSVGCQYRSSITGICCGSRYQLQVDHELPVALGGGNQRANLRLLCRTHNLMEAQRFGVV